MISESIVTFAAEHLDRSDHLRSQPEKIAAYLADPASRVSPTWYGKPLFDLTEAGPRLAWLSATDPIAADGPEAPLFLGLDAEGTAHFAVDANHIAPPEEKPSEFVDRRTLDLSETRKFIELRAIMGDITQNDAGVAATAKGIFEWRKTHGFCANCGGRNEVGAAGWRLDCPACGRQHFPRTDPVVIMLVLAGDRVLLGRQSFWPEGMYSLLAGFMEPGESIEAAVRRETKEEAGVDVDEVRYVVSQPWPFPASLMIGCAGRAKSDALVVNTGELEDAMWVSKAQMADALDGRDSKIAPARKGAVAQLILRAWVDGVIPDFD